MSKGDFIVYRSTVFIIQAVRKDRVIARPLNENIKAEIFWKSMIEKECLYVPKKMVKLFRMLFV